MWIRNILFIGFLGGAGLALGSNLMPPALPRPVTSHDIHSYHAADFQASVQRVNTTFQQGWKDQKIQPTTAASDLIVARRLSLALMGTVPSLEEIRQLEQLPDDERLPWWLDHVLQDRRFDDYFAERLARVCVGTEDGPFIFYRRRRFVSWLAEQMAKNQRYDQLVRDLICAEGLWTSQPATNFVSVTIEPDKKEKKNQPDSIRLAGRVTRAFLGLRLDCAQCHDHPFAEWKQADFQGLAAFFGETHVGFTGIYNGSGEFTVEDRKTHQPKTVDPCVPFAPELLPSGGSRRERLAAWTTSPKNPYFARAAVNRVWGLMTGRPLVEPVDNLQSDTPAPPALAVLADDFTAHDFDLRRLIRVIAWTQVYRLDSAADHDISEDEEKTWAVFPLTRLRPEQVVGSVFQTSTVTTVDAESHILVRLARAGSERDFVHAYGDGGEDEFDNHAGTIPQRLLMMNGSLVHDRIRDDLQNASTRIGMMAPDDAHAVEVAYLTVLSRRPTAGETEHFTHVLADRHLPRAQHMEDLFWALINSTEFSWNH